MSAPATIARLHGAPVDVVAADVAAILTGSASTIMRVGATSFTVQHSRRPVWVIVLAVLTFPLGLLFLLIKDTRVGSVSVVDEGGVVAVIVSGEVTDAVREALGDVAGSAGQAGRPASSAITPTSAPAARDESPTPVVVPPPATLGDSPGTGESARREDATRFRGAVEGVPRVEAPAMSPRGVRIAAAGGTPVNVPVGVTAYIGRRPTIEAGEVAVPVDDPQVSHTHAALRVLDGQVEVVDLDSRNGVLVGAGGEPLAPGHPRMLDLPAVVTVGATRLSIEVSS